MNEVLKKSQRRVLIVDDERDWRETLPDLF